MCEVLRFGPLDNTRVDSREFTVGSSILYNGWNHNGIYHTHKHQYTIRYQISDRSHLLHEIDDSVVSVCSLDRLSYLDGHLSTTSAIVFTNGRVSPHYYHELPLLVTVNP